MRSVLYSGNRIDRALTALGANDALDAAVRVVGRAAQAVPERGVIKDALSGTWLGHPLHPMLTDLPIGFWTSAFVLDLWPTAKYDDAARALVGLGILSSIPTALAGTADWSDTTGPARRVGSVHALVNSSAVALYTGSWAARRRGHRATGIGLALGGATLATVGGLLGGHLMAVLGVGVDHTAFEDAPREWTRACAEADVSEVPTRVQINADSAVVVVRAGGTIAALSATCPHRGAPLDEGQVDGDTIICPWHGSKFSLCDGSIVAGPTATPVRSYDVRVRDNDVEIRESEARA